MKLQEDIDRMRQMMGLQEQVPRVISVAKPLVKMVGKAIKMISKPSSAQPKKLPNTQPKKSLSDDKLVGVDPKLVAIFRKIEKEYGSPLPLKYGTRDKKTNDAANGAQNSAHLRGKAIDIKFPSPNKEAIKKLITLATKHGVLGLGVYRDGEDLHLDIDETLGRRAWGPTYKSDSIPDWARTEVSLHLNKK
jgi:uncharacterized protein YcbK (DUF882 family)